MIKKGDTVKVLAGDDKGKTGKVLNVFKADNKVLVEGVNMKKKTVKAKTENGKGQIVEKANPIHISNVVKAE